jgi:hypothetical protein
MITSPSKKQIMKKLILVFTIITVFAACKNGPEPIETTGAVQLLPSVAAYNSNINSDTGSAVSPELTPAKVSSRPTKIVYITREPAHTAANTSTAPVNQVPVPATTPVTPTVPGTGSTSGTSTQQGPGETNTKEVIPTIPQPEKKKGWSNAAKGAVIGAGAGAIGGAILSKKKGLGAVIGGVVGAAGGYIIGKNIDKKNATN